MLKLVLHPRDNDGRRYVKQVVIMKGDNAHESFRLSKQKDTSVEYLDNSKLPLNQAKDIMMRSYKHYFTDSGELKIDLHKERSW